jgi:hypothetical protein
MVTGACRLGGLNEFFLVSEVMLGDQLPRFPRGEPRNQELAVDG